MQCESITSATHQWYTRDAYRVMVFDAIIIKYNKDVKTSNLQYYYTHMNPHIGTPTRKWQDGPPHLLTPKTFNARRAIILLYNVIIIFKARIDVGEDLLGQSTVCPNHKIENEEHLAIQCEVKHSWPSNNVSHHQWPHAHSFLQVCAPKHMCVLSIQA